jgi:beta-aspartyl-peptidase (threonine type)
MAKYSLAIHGGAGTILKSDLTPVLEKKYKQGLQQALDAGFSILERGGTAIEAVKTASTYLEDDALFNAGKGSVFTKDGFNEMDAAIMDGRTLEAGAVAGVRNVRNPVLLAEQVMLYSGHVFLSGKGANDFAVKRGVKMEPDEYFFSQSRYDQLKEMGNTDEYKLDHNNISAVKENKFGTIGAVACDKNGNVAAATSTGGMTNKQFGRIGDSPIIGIGTYANNRTCAISCTGHGEPFIRAVVAYDVSCLMEYKNMSLHEACEEVVLKKLMKINGEGGLIGMDAEGNAALVFNCAGMYRGLRSSDGTNMVAIYEEDSK